MKKFFVRNAVNVVGLPLFTWAFLLGFVPWALAASTLTIEQSAHFLESDGSDVLLEAGTYDVDTLVGSQLRLDTSSGNTEIRFRWVPTIPTMGNMTCMYDGRTIPIDRRRCHIPFTMLEGIPSKTLISKQAETLGACMGATR